MNYIIKYYDSIEIVAEDGTKRVYKNGNINAEFSGDFVFLSIGSSDKWSAKYNNITLCASRAIYDAATGVVYGNITDLKNALEDSYIGATTPSVGNMIFATHNFQRPNDATAYAAKDVVSNSTSTPFPTNHTVARVNGGNGYIVAAKLQTNVATDTSQYRLHLFSATLSGIADNAPLAILWANRANYLGYITFPKLATEGTGSDVAVAMVADIRIPFQTASNSQKIYGLLEVLGAYTPTALQNYTTDLISDTN